MWVTGSGGEIHVRMALPLLIGWHCDLRKATRAVQGVKLLLGRSGIVKAHVREVWGGMTGKAVSGMGDGV
jgi:hypothetical protein